MKEKHYLFYEKKPLKEKWRELPLTDKFAYIVLGIMELGLFLAGILMFLANILASMILIFFCPFMFVVCFYMLKMYYVIFEEDYVYRGGSIWGAAYKKHIAYEKVCYIIVGDAGPMIYPRPNGTSNPEYYHKRFGNYINVLGVERNILFTVRYSNEIEEYLKFKCPQAQVIDIHEYSEMCIKKYTESDEIKKAEKELVDQYKGMV